MMIINIDRKIVLGAAAASAVCVILVCTCMFLGGISFPSDARHEGQYLYQFGNDPGLDQMLYLDKTHVSFDSSWRQYPDSKYLWEHGIWIYDHKTEEYFNSITRALYFEGSGLKIIITPTSDWMYDNVKHVYFNCKAGKLYDPIHTTIFPMSRVQQDAYDTILITCMALADEMEDDFASAGRVAASREYFDHIRGVKSELRSRF